MSIWGLHQLGYHLRLREPGVSDERKTPAGTVCQQLPGAAGHWLAAFAIQKREAPPAALRVLSKAWGETWGAVWQHTWDH